MSYNGNLGNYIKRRSFLLRAGLITGGIFLGGCLQKIKTKTYDIKGRLLGQNAEAGHILRDKIPLPKPTSNRNVKILIVGSGIAGLSAARWLKKQGENDFEILELEDHSGGNSHTRKNQTSAYPLGAHYITIANNDDELLIDFLKELNVITHFENNLPFYNEFYLTFDPEERLLINGEWQEGLIPSFGVPEKDQQQIASFLKEVEALKILKGSDEKPVFNIPIAASSQDENYLQLDNISFADYLKTKGYDSKYLLWYVNYACKDDYGRKIDQISAWAGLHYFSSRRGHAANAAPNAILTWPEGNGWIAQRMSENLKEQLHRSKMCYDIKLDAEQVLASVYDPVKKTTETITAEKVLLCTPQFVNKKLLKNGLRSNINYDQFEYAPWLIANITVNQMPAVKGMPLCWDNVAFNTNSVGYVNSAHQSLNVNESQKVLTYYLPLCDYEPSISRLAAYSRTYEQWLDMVIPELEFMHPGIKDFIEEVEFWVWGHGMISPTKNLIWSKNLETARKSISGKIFFAHSDLSGISIFEEAFHQGIRAAKEMLNGNAKV